MLKLLYSFLIGGSIFATVSYLSNIINDPILASIIGTLPMGIMTSYVIDSRPFLTKFANNVLQVLVITFVCVCLLIITLKKTNLEKTKAITFIIIVWLILQCIRYKFISKTPPISIG